MDHVYTRGVYIYIYIISPNIRLFFCKQRQRKEWVGVNTRPYVISKKHVTDTSSHSFATSITARGRDRNSAFYKNRRIIEKALKNYTVLNTNKIVYYVILYMSGLVKLSEGACPNLL